ncbi:unnamed protein product [Bursaphelenchus okinawaensis]|uniref:T20D4.11-like domain-containing protein n=1 Tax=Bursaphelenchus okinawaensis TaxID=465554 RepID=A0A811KD78_9BILA|nr:unnamed protein product [Bursaphelenchus okinawaensis]CAG9102447.1 unnamed protein product [Bursaphelenchus okinawaensis]
MRLRSALLLSTALGLMTTFVMAQEKIETGCANDMFLCPREASCIPYDWVGDGENDCEDGADEIGQAPRISGPVKNKNKPMSSDPFSESHQQDQPPPNQLVGNPADCSANHKAAMTACVENLDSWATDLAFTNFSQVSIFNDELSMAKVEQGCALLQEFSSCMDGLPASCVPEQKELQDFQKIQMYACELLVPSLKEHLNCFGKARDQKCGVPSAPGDKSVICRLVSSVHADINCVAQVRPEECDEVAIELFEPMKQETQHVLDDLQCSQSSGSPSLTDSASDSVPPNVATSSGRPIVDLPLSRSTAVNPATAQMTTIEVPTSEDVQARTTQEVEAQTSEPSTGSAPVSQPSLPDDGKQESNERIVIEEPSMNEQSMDEQPKQVQAVQPTRTTTTTSKSENKPKSESSSKSDGKPASDADSKSETKSESRSEAKTTKAPVAKLSPASKQVLDLSNSLFAFGNVDQICNVESKDDVWAPVRKRICHRKEDLIVHSNCFLETALKDKQCVADKSTKSSPCATLEAFNKNVDCVIVSLNDLCPVEAQDVVIAIQESLNDEAIDLKCYEEKDKVQREEEKKAGKEEGDGFSLSPQNPRCNGDQENAALVCLVELVEINKKLSEFHRVNFLLEVSDAKSKLMNEICDLYSRYDQCLVDSVFSKNGGQRCSFNSPLNTLARIGLSPICTPKYRQLLVQSRDCLMKVANEPGSAQCQAGLHHLGDSVGRMIQGIHGEALLCKSFYTLRDAFNCGEALVQRDCDAKTVEDLNNLKELMTSLGLEEGCPAQEPANLNEIISRPVQQPAQVQPKTSPPVARPMTPTPAAACEAHEQAQFGECVKPLTAFKPHPIAVVAQPKDIAQACEAHKNFLECRKNLQCFPLWARGMSAMFDYACNAGADKYSGIKQCVRKVTTRADVRECVNTFSKSAPQEACVSTNRLLGCALPPITEKCGHVAKEFVTEYVRKFANTIDSNCKVGEEFKEEAVRAISTFNCTANEDQIIEHCSAPLNDISARLDDLFHGGLQSILKNLNSLAPVFAQGCNLTAEFRTCAKPVLERDGPCTVSSCLVRAGNGICNQPDVVEAIDTNLGCIFKQVNNPEFGKCLRNTIATLKDINLSKLKAVLPEFVDCVEPIVVDKCGIVPVNVLKALGSREVCPIGFIPEPLLEATPVSTTQATCTEEKKQQFAGCIQPIVTKYPFMPISLVAKGINGEQVCHDVETYQKCYENIGVCPEPAESASLRNVLSQLCAARTVFDQHRTCLSDIAEGPKAKDCFKDSESCESINAGLQCVAESVNEQCGPDALQFAFNAMNDRKRECRLQLPSVALQTGCSEDQLISYLECDSIIDNFHFQPITFISNASEWDAFCSIVETKYRPCLDKLSCRFEPVSTASLTLFENLCEREITRRDQRKFAECLAEVADSSEGKQCLEVYKSVDLLAKNANEQVCSSVNEILNCASGAITKTCGDDALLHVYDIHGTWVQVFNATCVLQPVNFEEKTKTITSRPVMKPKVPEPEPIPEPEPEPSQRPHHVDILDHDHHHTSPQPEPEPEPTSAPPASGAARVGRAVVGLLVMLAAVLLV